MKKEQMDLTGQKFGKLLVIGNGKEQGYYSCICDCTEGLPNRPVVEIRGKYLKDGSTESCGCIRSEHISKLPKNNTGILTKPEIKQLPYYNAIKRIWRTNLSHCNPDHNDAKKSYIKKDIKFCDEWDNGFLGFVFFYTWCIRNNYIGGKSQLCRKDKNLGFSPENCTLIDKPKRKKKEIKSKDKNATTKIPSENKELASQPKDVNKDNVANTEEILSINFNKLGIRLLVDGTGTTSVCSNT